jgi:hypothetical protein
VGDPCQIGTFGGDNCQDKLKCYPTTFYGSAGGGTKICLPYENKSAESLERHRALLQHVKSHYKGAVLYEYKKRFPDEVFSEPKPVKSEANLRREQEENEKAAIAYRKFYEQRVAQEAANAAKRLRNSEKLRIEQEKMPKVKTERNLLLDRLETILAMPGDKRAKFYELERELGGSDAMMTLQHDLARRKNSENIRRREAALAANYGGNFGSGGYRRSKTQRRRSQKQRRQSRRN